MFRSKYEKILNAKLNQITAFRQVHTKMITSLMKVNAFLRNMQFSEASGYVGNIIELCILLEGHLMSFMKLEVSPILDTGAKLSVSRESVETKKDAVFAWIGRVKDLTKQSRNKLSNRPADPFEISRSFDSLMHEICQDESLSDLTVALQVLAMESVAHSALDRELADHMTSVLNKLKLHPTIRKSSERLFKNGHYAEAIFEAYKALIILVKEKSGKRTLSDRALMGVVFDVDYVRESLTVTKCPILKLNELDSIEKLDEQKGFFYLFLGSLIGIRNPKAHASIVQKNPLRALEYLCLASLLAKRVDEART
jgi:uncharacterized protein (TIGR02391 family)